MGIWVNNIWSWRLQLFVEVEDNLQNQKNELMRIISTVQLVRGKQDSWCCIKEGSGLYTVSSANEELMNFDISEDDQVFNYLWASLGPSNAKALGWRVLLDRVQTKVNLLKRNMPISNGTCPFCSRDDESTNYLFFSCLLTWRVWAAVARRLGWVIVFLAQQRNICSNLCGINQ